MATGGHFGFWLLTNSAAIFARVMGAKFFINTSKSSNQVSNLTMLSVVTGPPDCTQLNSKVHGANLAPIWGRQDPSRPNVGPMNFAIWGSLAGREWQRTGQHDLATFSALPRPPHARLRHIHACQDCYCGTPSSSSQNSQLTLQLVLIVYTYNFSMSCDKWITLRHF